jgi:hypothetical protein
MRKTGFAVRRLLPVVVVVASLVLAAFVAGAKGNSAAATVSFAGNATIVVDPLGPVEVGPVEVTLHYSCLPPSPGFLAVNLDENGIAGGTVLEATCDGKNQTVTVTVDGTFVPGTAAGRAAVTNGSGGAFASTNEQVLIK